jgi:hypothetical protein
MVRFNTRVLAKFLQWSANQLLKVGFSREDESAFSSNQDDYSARYCLTTDKSDILESKLRRHQNKTGSKAGVYESDRKEKIFRFFS